MGKDGGEIISWPGTRKFNGKGYRFQRAHPSKTEANKRANALRKKGHKARVVKKRHLYGIYKRG